MKTPVAKEKWIGDFGRKAGLHGQIAEYLGVRILNGVLSPGEILPTEAALGASMQVSRTAVREAIKVLTSKGLIEVRRKTGTRVRPAKDWSALDPDVIAWQFSGGGQPAALMDLLELRQMIEPIGARMAAERATSQEVEEIQAAFVAMEGSIGKTSASVEADLSFHLAILEATHNSFMRSFGALIQAALRSSFRLTNKDAAAYQQSLLKHRAVMTAIGKRRAKAAEAAMHVVLQGTRHDIEQVLGSKKGRKISSR